MDMHDVRYTDTNSEPDIKPQTATGQPKKNRPWFFIVALVVVIVALAFVFLFDRKGAIGPDLYDDAGNPVHIAKEGEIIEGFPTELLLEPDAVVEGSARIDYLEHGVSLPSVQYISKLPYAHNIDEYRRLLQDQGWIIQKDAFYEEMPVTNFYAVRGDTETVNIVLAPSNEGVSINIAYSSLTSSN